MNKNPPSTGRIAAMVGFTLSVAALLMFLWRAVRRHAAAAGRRATASRRPSPRPSLLVKEADVRMAGVNIGKVKQKELGAGRAHHAGRDGDRPPLRADRPRRARDPAPEEPPRRDLRGDHAGQPGRADLADGGHAARARTWTTPSSSTRCSACSTRRRATAFQQWLHEAGIVTSGTLRARLQRLARERRAVLHGRRRPAAAAGRAGGGAAPGVPRHRPRVPRRLARGRPAARADHERRRDLRRAGLARRRARRDVPDLPDLPARDAQRRCAASRRSRATPTRWCATCAEPAHDLAPTLRDLGDLSPDLEHAVQRTSPRSCGRRRPACPAATRFLRGAEPVLEATHVFMPELNPILSYLSFARGQLAQFITVGGAALGGNGEGGYHGQRRGGALPAADRDHRRPLASQRRPDAAGLGAGERVHRAERLRARHAAGRDRELRLQAERRRAAQPDGRRRRPPRRPASRRRRSSGATRSSRACAAARRPFVSAPKGREGTSPATP